MNVANHQVILLIGSSASSLVNFRGPLIEALTARGHRIVACAPEDNGQVREALVHLGAEYRPLAMCRTGLNFISDLKTLWKLVCLIKEIRPGAVFSYTVKPVVYGSMAAWICAVPKCYAMITGLGYAFVSDDKKAIFVRWVVKVLYWLSLRLNEKVFFQNEDDRALFVSLGLLPSPEHAVVVPGSGVDLEKFSLAQLPDAHNFLLIARLLRDKGIREYANAAAIVKKKYPDCSFLLVGGGDVGNPAAISKQDLDRWIHEGTLEYLGFMEDVRLAIARCKVYVLPSYREGTPRTVLEAMAMGRPIITTNVPGCREPVQDNYNGFLVPARNSVHLATAMLRMIEIPELAAIMGKRSRHIVEQRYDARVVACKMLDEMKL